MYPILHDIFKDKEGDEVFTCFTLWHFFYVFLAVAAIAISVYLFRNKEQSEKEKVLKLFVGIAFGLYVFDFFAMPFAYGEIDVDKLPFHACTAMSVMCFLSRHNHFLRKYRVHFAMLALLSNLSYLIYPAGVMSYEIHPLSYRAVQTLVFHGAMTVYGFLTIILDDEKPDIKHCHRDVIILAAMTVWAMIGNALYSGAAGDYDHDFNWFFVKADPFGALPENIAMYICPWMNIVAFFTLEVLICLIVGAVQKHKKVENNS